MTLKSDLLASKGMQSASAAFRRPRTKAGMSIVAERVERPFGQCMRSAVQKRVASSGESHSNRKLSGTGSCCGCCIATGTPLLSWHERNQGRGRPRTPLRQRWNVLWRMVARLGRRLEVYVSNAQAKVSTVARAASVAKGPEIGNIKGVAEEIGRA